MNRYETLRAHAGRGGGPPPRRRRRRGFTLVEVISVMVVMVLVLTIAVGAHLMWKRQNALDAVVAQVLAHLALARQHAIAQALPITFTVSNLAVAELATPGRLSLTSDLSQPSDAGWFFVSVATNALDDAVLAAGVEVAADRTLLSDVVRLPRRVRWDLDLERARSHVTFRADGSCPDESDPELALFQDIAPGARTNALLRRVIRVNRLTGLARTLAPASAPGEEARP